MSALQSLVKVAAPLYGGEIFQRVGHERRPEVIFFHYVFLSIVVWAVFPPGWKRPKTARSEKNKKEEDIVAAAAGNGEQVASGSGADGAANNKDTDTSNGFAYATIHATSSNGTDTDGEIVVIGPQPSQAPPVIRRVRDRWERGSRVKVA